MTDSKSTQVDALGLGQTSQQVTDRFRQQLLAALADPLFNVPKAFETWIVDRVAIAGLNIPLGQIIGYERLTQASRVHLAAAQTYTTATTGTLDFDTVDYDYGGMWDATNHQFVVQVDGKYVVGTGVSWTANATGQRVANIELNGTVIQSVTMPNLGSGSTVDINIVTTYDLAAGDELLVVAEQTSGGDLDVLAGVVTNFWIARIGT